MKDSPVARPPLRYALDLSRQRHTVVLNLESTDLQIFPEPYQVQGTALCPVLRGQRCTKHDQSLQEIWDFTEAGRHKNIQSLVTKRDIEQRCDIEKHIVFWSSKDCPSKEPWEPSGKQETEGSGEPLKVFIFQQGGNLRSVFQED